MTVLTITDIRKSFCDRGFDLVTAVFLGSEDHDFNELKSLDEKRIVILESSTAQKENPEIGVRCGDQYVRMKIKMKHGLCVGEAITFNDMHET